MDKNVRIRMSRDKNVPFDPAGPWRPGVVVSRGVAHGIYATVLGTTVSGVTYRPGSESPEKCTAAFWVVSG